MVCRVEEAMKVMMKQKQQQQQQQQQKSGKDHQRHIIQCNKGKSCRFKRSTSNVDDDGASSAILLLACIACAAPSFSSNYQ